MSPHQIAEKIKRVRREDTHQIVLGAGYPETCWRCGRAHKAWLEAQKNLI